METGLLNMSSLLVIKSHYHPQFFFFFFIYIILSVKVSNKRLCAVSLIATAVAASGWSVNLIVFLVAELNIGSITATLIDYFIFRCRNLFSVVAVVVAARSFFDPLSVVRIFSFISLLVTSSLFIFLVIC